jgi:hypothetical protein
LNNSNPIAQQNAESHQWDRNNSPAPNSPRALLRFSLHYSIWNGIFAGGAAFWNGIFDAGDWRAKRGLKTMSPRRDQKLETTTR